MREKLYKNAYFIIFIFCYERTCLCDSISIDEFSIFFEIVMFFQIINHFFDLS